MKKTAYNRLLITVYTSTTCGNWYRIIKSECWRVVLTWERNKSQVSALQYIVASFSSFFWSYSLHFHPQQFQKRFDKQLYDSSADKDKVSYKLGAGEGPTFPQEVGSDQNRAKHNKSCSFQVEWWQSSWFKGREGNSGERDWWGLFPACQIPTLWVRILGRTLTQRVWNATINYLFSRINSSTFKGWRRLWVGF